MPASNKPDTRGKLHLVLLVLLACAFAAALLWMLNLRLGSGDSFPPYSSFRADPLGSRALHDALGRLDGTSAHRHMRRIQYLETDNQTTVLFLGLSPNQLRWQDKNERAIAEQWLSGGCRIVIALAPLPEDFKDRAERRGWKKPRDDKQDKDNDEEQQNGTGNEQADDAALEREGLYGITASREPKRRTNLPQIPQADFAGVALPVWHGSHVLDIQPGSGWSVLATANGQPTIALLQRGRGSILITTDSYPFANEAQTKSRHTSFLLALLGEKSRFVFNESHLGVNNEPGLVSLLRQYHLHGIIAGGILLFLTLLWQGAGSLIPVDANQDIGADSSGRTSGRDSSDGLVALLETGLPPHRLLDECVTRHLAAHKARPPHEDTILQARTIAGGTGTGKLARDYLQITRLFNRHHPSYHHGNH